jgi:hypothetical protein
VLSKLLLELELELILEFPPLLQLLDELLLWALTIPEEHKVKIVKITIREYLIFIVY